MWERFKRFHAKDGNRDLQYLRLMYGLMGIALGFFTIWGLANGSDVSTQFIVMALLAVLGIAGAFAYTKLLRERNDKGGSGV